MLSVNKLPTCKDRGECDLCDGCNYVVTLSCFEHTIEQSKQENESMETKTKVINDMATAVDDFCKDHGEHARLGKLIKAGSSTFKTRAKEDNEEKSKRYFNGTDKHLLVDYDRGVVGKTSLTLVLDIAREIEDHLQGVLNKKRGNERKEDRAEQIAQLESAFEGQGLKLSVSAALKFFESNSWLKELVEGSFSVDLKKTQKLQPPKSGRMPVEG